MSVKIFISYSHHDEALFVQLKKHLKPLERERIISPWHDRRIAAGAEFDAEIRQELQSARIILLLVSPDFIVSEYCWGKEMMRAMERHETGSARVIPVILRPVDWRGSPFGKLLALPQDGKPVTSWQDVDAAFLNVATSIRSVTAGLHGGASLSGKEVAEPDEHRPKSKHVVPYRGSGNATVLFTLVLPPDVMTNKVKAIIDLYRHKIILDGADVAKIRYGETIPLNVPPGVHNIQLRRAFLKSNLLVLEVAPGAKISVECKSVTSEDSLTYAQKLSAASGLQDTWTLKRRS